MELHLNAIPSCNHNAISSLKVLNINIISRLNQVPLVYFYSALVQLLSNFVVDKDNTLVLH